MAATRGPGRGGTSRPRSRATGPRTPAAPARGGVVQGAAARRGTPPHLVRLGLLVVLLAFLALFLTPTLRGYLDQRAEINRTERQITSEQARIDELTEELALWDDDAHLEAQARERLRFVKPGEVVFTVLDDTGEQLTEPVPGMVAVTNDVHEHRPWYGEVWESVRAANEGLPETEGAGD
mgnify:CR=1 FL=1